MAKKEDKKIVLLDSHAIMHRAYHALPDFSTAKGEPTGALYGLCTMLLKIIDELSPDYIIAAYDLPGATYRHEAFSGYKSGRAKTEDALSLQIERSRDIFKAFNIPIYDRPGFEADDILGTLVEILSSQKGVRVIIASGDMDTLQLVDGKKVTVYTLRKGISDTVIYDEDAVYSRFGFGPELLADYKGLRGDPSDNIPGVAGIGEKTATTLISNFGSLEKVLKLAKEEPEKLKKAGIKDRIINLLKENVEEAEFSKMLATIRRDAPIDFSIPQKEWIESLNFSSVESLFSDLEFRTLGARLKEIIKKRSQKSLGSFGANQEGHEAFEEDASSSESHSEREIAETSVALWLLNSNITDPSKEDILQYAKTRNFAQAKEKILKEIEEKKLTFVYEEIERPLIPIVKLMEERGVKIDRAFLSKLSSQYHKELESRESKIWEAAGENFNINSPKQLGHILFDRLAISVKNQKRTGTGMKSTRESELEKMKDLHPIIPLILEYREFQKLLSTYIDNIPQLLDSNDRLHTSLRQAGTTTGRMSSTNPNLQNIPIRTELGRNIRKAFVSERGFSLLSFDYSQIELRVAAILSKDEKLMEIFRNGKDVHEATASFVFGVKPENVDKEMRRKAKIINFGILYGMGVNALRQNLGGTRDEAQKFLNDYLQTFEGLTKYLEGVKKEVEERGYTETLFGRRRYFEAIKSKIPYIRASAERMAINAPIQGTATADIIKIAMRDIYRWLEKENLQKDVHMILQVHDELLFELRDGLVEKVAPEIKKIMERVLPEEKSQGVPIIANAHVGKNWDNMSQILS